MDSLGVGSLTGLSEYQTGWETVLSATSLKRLVGWEETRVRSKSPCSSPRTEAALTQVASLLRTMMH